MTTPASPHDAAAPAAAPMQAQQAPSVARMFAALAGIAALSGLLLSATYQVTYGIIERNREEQLRAAVFEVLPADVVEQRAFEVLPDGAVRPNEGPGAYPVVYVGYREDGTLAGVAVEASGLGYGDIIRVLYGYDPVGQTLTGFKVLESKETPGLGDRIAQRPFVDNFIGMSVPLDDAGTGLQHPIQMVKAGTASEPWEVDAISGATVSSHAVGGMLQRSTSELLPIIHAQVDQLKRKN